MTIKMKFLCVVSALSFLASTACFSAYAAELLDERSGDDEPVVSYEPAVDPIPEPDPIPQPDPEPDPGYDPGYEPDPGYDPIQSYEPDPGYNSEPGDWSSNIENSGESEFESNYSAVTTSEDYTSQFTVSDFIDESSYLQQEPGTVSDFTDYNQYTSGNYVNPYSAVYDDNYVYIPSYTEPTQSLIDTNSKVVNTDELTQDDWASIMLDLEAGNISDDGTKTFNFIKQNDEQGDTSIKWMLYLGVALILLSIFLIIFVVISTQKANRKYAL